VVYVIVLAKLLSPSMVVPLESTISHDVSALKYPKISTVRIMEIMDG
jgi:hypothetical protein